MESIPEVCILSLSPWCLRFFHLQLGLALRRMASTHPEQIITHFVEGPSGRGTLGLVWSSFVTIFLCAWTIQRLNIAQKPSTELQVFWRKLLWMIITIMAPEYTALIAFDQWRKARKTEDMQALGLGWWQTVHGFYAEMGGIAVRLNSNPRFQASRTGTTLEVSEGIQYVIRSMDLRTLVEKKIIQLPEIPKPNIDERSKTDAFARCITAIQVMWFASEKIARLAAHLPIALLELSTMAFIACSAMTGFFWWHKPLDVRTSTVFTISPEKESEFLKIYPQLDFAPNEQDLAEKVAPREFWTDLNEKRKYTAKHALWIGSVFNGIHIAAWNATFPSATERTMWRACSIGAWGSLLTFYAALFLRNEAVRLIVAIGILAPLYTTARLYLVVEALIELRSLPAKVYDNVPWSQFLPHT